MNKYIIKVRKKAVEVAVIAENIEQAIEKAKDVISHYDFSVPEAYDYIEGREATEKDIKEFNFDN